jgi:hypothetical protein
MNLNNIMLDGETFGSCPAIGEGSPENVDRTYEWYGEEVQNSGFGNVFNA